MSGCNFEELCRKHDTRGVYLISTTRDPDSSTVKFDYTFFSSPALNNFQNEKI